MGPLNNVFTGDINVPIVRLCTAKRVRFCKRLPVAMKLNRAKLSNGKQNIEAEVEPCLTANRGAMETVLGYTYRYIWNIYIYMCVHALHVALTLLCVLHKKCSFYCTL